MVSLVIGHSGVMELGGVDRYSGAAFLGAEFQSTAGIDYGVIFYVLFVNYILPRSARFGDSGMV